MSQGAILLVDDEPLIRDLLVDILAASGDFKLFTAGNGREALEVFKREEINLVFTDLRMPEMDGIKLLAELRRVRGDIPVVILTGYGRREDVIEAMRLGAVNFLMKPQEIELVHSIAAKILRVQLKQQLEQRIFDYFVNQRMVFCIPSDLKYSLPLIDVITDNISRAGICDSYELTNVRLALDEALTNAIIHGNLEITSHEKGSNLIDMAQFDSLVRSRSAMEPYAKRKVTVISELTQDEVRFEIQDEGMGFDWRSLPENFDEAELLASHGRGLLLIRSFMSDVRFRDPGNHITLVKRRNLCAEEVSPMVKI